MGESIFDDDGDTMNLTAETKQKKDKPKEKREDKLKLNDDKDELINLDTKII